MVERGNSARFALKALLAVHIRGELERQDLNGDIAPQPCIPRAIHLAHPARAERVQDFVGSQPNSGGQWHWAAILHRKRFVTPKRRYGIRSVTAYILATQ